MNFYKSLKAKEFTQHYLNDDNAVLIDARTEKEYQKSNIDEAINIVYTNKEELLKLDNSKNYYIHCRVGGRSAVAAFILSQAGYTNVINLNDAIENLMSEFQQAKVN